MEKYITSDNSMRKNDKIKTVIYARMKLDSTKLQSYKVDSYTIMKTV